MSRGCQLVRVVNKPSGDSFSRMASAISTSKAVWSELFGPLSHLIGDLRAANQTGRGAWRRASRSLSESAGKNPALGEVDFFPVFPIRSRPVTSCGRTEKAAARGITKRFTVS